MTDAAREDKPLVVLSNTTVVQDESGKLGVFVNGVRMVGAGAVQINGEGTLVLAMPSHAFRIAGQHESKLPVYETKDNVINVGFPLIREYREKWKEQGIDPNKDDPTPEQPA